MAIEAWFMDDNGESQQLPHHRQPQEFVSLDYLAELGVLYWHLNPEKYENDEELNKIRKDRGYNYMDLLDLCPEKLANYEEKLKNFYTEHIHADEEIRYCLEGMSGTSRIVGSESGSNPESSLFCQQESTIVSLSTLKIM